MTIDCSRVQSREDLFHLFREVLPGEFRSNLDALHDHLTSLPEQTEVTLLNWYHAEEALGRYAKALQRMLADSETENSLLTIHYK